MRSDNLLNKMNSDIDFKVEHKSMERLHLNTIEETPPRYTKMKAN